MNDKVYHPVHYGEAQEVLDRSERILNECESLKKKCPKEYLAAFISLVYYPACGTANLMKLWITAGRNQLYASQNRVEANDLAAMIPEIEEFDDLKPYGRTGSAIKIYPVTADFLEKEERPFVEYDFAVGTAGDYELTFYLAATTPVVYERIQYIGFSVNDGEVIKENTVEDPFRQFFLSPQWKREAYSNIKLHHSRISLVQGKNTFKFYGMSPAIVLERIVVRRADVPVKESYLGPKESYYLNE